MAAILAGGVIAAPIAAWLVRHIPPRLLGASVGGLIVLTNVRSLLRADLVTVPAAGQTAIYVLVVVGWAAAFGYALRQYLRDRDVESSDAVSRVREEQERAASEDSVTVPG